jgi:DNA repair exonuclease SbcCD ATPase subunit
MADEVKGEMPEKAEGEKPEAEQAQDKQTPEQLQAELEKLRTALKERNREEAGRRKKLETLEAEKAEREQAAMTEAQKLQATVKRLEDEKAAALAQAGALALRAEIMAKAGEFHDPEDVYLALKDKLSVGADGVEGLAAALKDLKQQKPHWLKGKAAPSLHGGNPGQNANGDGETREQRRRRLGI